MNDRGDDSEIKRLGVSGSEADRQLLRAAASVRVPPGVQEDVRRALEARLTGAGPRGRRTRLGLATLAVLLTGTAAASWWTGRTQTPPLAQPDAPAKVTTVVKDNENRAPAPVVAAAPQAAPARQPSSSTPAPASRAAPLRPGLELGAYLNAKEPASPAAPPPPGERLVVRRSGRADVVLFATPGRLRGQIRGTAIDLAVIESAATDSAAPVGSLISGRIGNDAIEIHKVGAGRATGNVGGRPLGFSFNPTDHGLRVDASLPNLAGRVRLDHATLYFYPGCDQELPAAAAGPGVYEGRCADAASVHIELPPAFMKLAPRARMVVLALLLPEAEPGGSEDERPLFPAP